MTWSRPRSAWALTAPVLVALLALGSLAMGLRANPASAITNLAATPIQVSIQTLRPLAPQPGKPLVVAGTLKNIGTSPVSDLKYALKEGNQFTTRGEFDQYAADPTGDLDYTDYGFINHTNAVKTPTQEQLAPGESEAFSITVPDIDSLALPTPWGVYALGVEVSGQVDLGPVSVVGQVRTFLPWAPRTSAVGKSVRLSWLLTLEDRPHRNADGTWFDDDLQAELAPAGRLSRLLTAGLRAETQSRGPRSTVHDVPLTWAIDPMLISDVEAMSAGYQIAHTSTGSNGKPVTTTSAGTGATLAKNWLTQLQTAVTQPGVEVLPLPFGDPDVVAAARAKFSTTIGQLTTSGTALLEHDLTGAQFVASVGWPTGGFADLRAVNALTATGDQALVLDSQALPPIDGTPSETPSSRTEFSTNTGTVNALLTDDGLDAEADNPDPTANGQRTAVQQLVAETLMIQSEKPSEQRTLLVAPTRGWNPSASYVTGLLDATGDLPWLQPVNLGSVVATPPWTEVARSPLQYPASARHLELRQSYLRQVSTVQTDIASFSAILPPGNTEIRGYTTALNQTLSASWRADPLGAATALNALGSTVMAQMNQVRIASRPKSYVTLTSHGGRVPITISNNLDTNVSVTVQVLPNQRLSLANDGKVSVTVLAHKQEIVNLQATAKTSGVFTFKVRLLTPEGQTYGSTVLLHLRSTVYGTITLAITGAATGALLIAVAIRLTRRGIAARRTAKAAAA